MEELTRGSKYHPLLSFMSPKMYETYCQMPKPMELSGRWASPNWADPKFEQVKCLDVKGCRSNALLDGLPTFSPLDDWEEYLDEDGCPRRPLDSYDFLYVSIPDVDLCDKDVAEAHFPYTGARSYCLGAVLYLVKQGIVENDHIVYGIRASRHLEPAKLGMAFEKVKEAAEKALKDEWSECDEEGRKELLADFVKLLRLSWIGLCQATERLEWHEVRSMYVADSPGEVKRREYLGHGVWSFKSCTQVVDLCNMRPYGDIALQMEQCFMHRAMEIMKSIPRARTWGVHVDGLFLDKESFDMNVLEDILVKHTYPSGKEMFQIKDAPGSSLPMWPRRYEERSVDLDLGGLNWRFLAESDAGDQDPQDFFVEQIVANKGGLMNCYGGTGKTVVIKRLVKRLCEIAKEEGVNQRIVVMSARHAAKAQLPEGQTIAHVKHKFAKAQNVFYIVD
jgi:hypothetical protein